jgi:hypothetical protein
MALAFFVEIEDFHERIKLSVERGSIKAEL